ncbi:MAG: hypothetical protein WBD07_11840 [Vicinamibacterales bacterium]
MRYLVAVALAAVLAVSASAQTRGQRGAAPAPAAPAAPPPPPTPEIIAPEVTCPTPLGVGVKTQLAFCDVMTGRDPAQGIIVKLPPHEGTATLTFDLHNRHTYSEEQVRARRAFTRYTATVGVLTMDNTLISRAVVQNEFRTEADLVDRISGSGPGAVKAVAPTGTESITITIPEGEQQVSILGEKVTIERLDGSATYPQPGRPIADISNVLLEYRPPAPPPPPPPARSAAPRPATPRRGR